MSKWAPERHASQSRDGTFAQNALVGAAGLPASAAARARRIPGVVAATGVRRTRDITLNNGTLAGRTPSGLDDHVLIRTAPWPG
jgi:putative ABC transport system permease protein